MPQQPDDLRITVSAHGPLTVVALAGELDLEAEDAFRAALRDAERPGEVLVVDMSALDFVDSTGSRILIEAHGRARQRGGRLIVVSGTGTAHLLLARSGLDRYLTLVPDLEQAAASARPGGGAV
ncbi:MAG TPA: STAS domain-containing protein [Miltoncostaeaceae bacterium]|nr:STAS domain-containing protein [Miltoncostaeaceae bacterium]